MVTKAYTIHIGLWSIHCYEAGINESCVDMVTVHASEIYSTGNRYSTGIQWAIKLVAFKNNALPTTLREVIYACSGTHIFSLTNGMYTFTYNFTALRPILFPNAFVMPLPIRDWGTSALNSALTTSATRVLRVFFSQTPSESYS